MSTAPTDPAMLAGLALLLRAPSKDAVAALFEALFAQRHGLEEARVAAVAAQLALSAEEAPALASAANALLRRVLYDSSELPSVEAVRALLPPELDSRLQSLLAAVLYSGLNRWREVAVERRVGLPHLEGVSWSVLAVNSTSATASANEAALRLRLSVRDQPSLDGAMPASRDVFVAVSPASLGAMLEGMRRVKEQLGAFS